MALNKIPKNEIAEIILMILCDFLEIRYRLAMKSAVFKINIYLYAFTINPVPDLCF